MTTQFFTKPAMTKMTFSQDEDTSSERAGEVEQNIEIEVVYIPGHDAADGNPERYFVIKTERWAFDDIKSLLSILEKAGVPMEAT